MIVALDMDGTLADLYGVPDWLNRILGQDATPYRDAAPLTDMGALAREVGRARAAGIHVEVITWAPGGDPAPSYVGAVGEAKRAWLDAHGLADVPMRYLAYHSSKRDGVAGRAILVDDDARAREDWERDGDGPTVEPHDVVRQLGRIVDRYLATGR